MRGSAESGKVIARVAGVLFITATAASLLSTSLLNPVLNGSGYLAKTFANQDRVIVGAGLELVAAFSSAAIAISLYRSWHGTAPAWRWARSASGSSRECFTSWAPSGHCCC
jgi:hypothetical protein